MPCITGPYTNVSATLTLQGSKIRREPMVGATKLLDVPRRHSVSIATSTAQNDAGVFELSFRDPRYMPFEGAGAVSRWKLSLPSAFRQFDYQIINDVVLHLGYTAEENDALRGQVEALNSAVEGTLLNMIENASLARVFSFRHDFSGSFNRLKHSALGTVVPFTITEKHFPIFLRGRAIHVTRAHLAIRAFDSQALGTLTFHLDGHDRAGFTAHADLVGLLGTADMSADYTGGLVGAHTIEVKDVGGLAPDAPSVGDPSALDEDKLLDIVLYFEYSVGAQ